MTSPPRPRASAALPSWGDKAQLEALEELLT